jgi:5-methylthioribose kinase
VRVDPTHICDGIVRSVILTNADPPNASPRSQERSLARQNADRPLTRVGRKPRRVEDVASPFVDPRWVFRPLPTLGFARIGSTSRGLSVLYGGTTRAVPTPITSLVVDIENASDLLRYLRESERIGKEETPTLRTLRGGVSNKTVLLQRPDGSRWVLKQALPKLRVQADWFSDPARIRVEANALRYLPLVTPANTIPKLLFEDEALYLLAMEAVPDPHENWKERLLCGRVDRDFIDQFGRLLASFHRRSYELRQELFSTFEDRAFFESLRLEPYYQFTGERVPEAASFLHDVIQANRTHCVTLVHGDYSPKNILVYQGRLILLDHEVVHVGDPAFDLGFSLTHLLSKGHHLKEHRSAFLAAAIEYWKTYETETGSTPWFSEMESRAVNNTISCLLARTSGRSPLEYLSADERSKQKAAALQLITHRPPTVPALIAEFGRRIQT